MRPNRGGKSVPPGRGGYDSEIVEVTGEPVYHITVPPAKYRGPLIPAGDGGDSFNRPAPDLRRRRAGVKVPTDKLVAAVRQLVELYPPAERRALLVALLPAFGLGDAAGQIEALVAAK
ncbi:MAG TPA: hypothetical protein VMZ71_17755 [Gemmataceae bacterium]|nr:hypothetical protein [Gemmataceae bacterium]